MNQLTYQKSAKVADELVITDHMEIGNLFL